MTVTQRGRHDVKVPRLAFRGRGTVAGDGVISVADDETGLSFTPRYGLVRMTFPGPTVLMV